MTAELEIRNSTEALRSAVNVGDIAGILACWAPDGVLLPPHHPLVRGHAAIAAYFDGVFAARRLTFTFTDSVITIAEDVAIERLTFTARVTAVRDGTMTEDVGKGLHVYARQTSGGWKLVQDIWNSDRALPARDVSSSGSALATPDKP
ncbi:MAG TPA: DUF4440 domain-containing protein [Gemmatimonadaceae bacterium]|nr:DUF4440 domain-containing protein [Gemmatimonadaceae bacterium]